MAEPSEGHEDQRLRPVAVRRAGPGDFDAWFALFASVAAEGRWLGAEAPVDPAPRRAFFDRSIAGDDVALFLADEGGGVVGSISVDLHGGIADIGMAVAGHRRGRGIGGDLLRAALDFARERGAHKMSLVVWPHNHAARALYSKFGFVTEGLRRRHYRRRSGALWDAVFMGLVFDESSPGGPDSERRRPPAPLPFPPGGLVEGDIRLRPLTTADARAIVAGGVDGGIARCLDGLPDADELGDADELLASARRQMAEGRGVVLAVARALDGIHAPATSPPAARRAAPAVATPLLGVVDLTLDHRDRHVGHVRYWVAASFRGRGVATAAVRAASRWAFDELGLRRLEALCGVDDTSSRAVALRAGFEFEGIRRAWRSIRGQATDVAAYARVAGAPRKPAGPKAGPPSGSDEPPG